MRVPGFVFGGYEAQSPIGDQEKTVNWYPEMAVPPGVTARQALYPTPGVTSLSTGDSNPGRAHFFENDREFAVIGTIFYEVDVFGTLTSRGTVTLDGNPATISSNGDGGDQLWVTSGTNGYVYDLTANTLTQVAAMDGKCTMGDEVDGYFLTLDASTSTLYISALLDGTSWTTGTDFAQRSIQPDPWISMKVHGRYIWLFGEQTSEVWYNVGANFPFAPHPSGLVRYGISAPFSAAIADQSIIWLGSSVFGDGFVLQASGFQPQIVSQHALQTTINGYTKIDDAQAWSYNDLGHTFYMLNFPTEDETHTLDAGIGVWHERGTWIAESNEFIAWRPRWHAQAFGEHRVLDSATGDLYRLSSDLLTDVDGRVIRRLRRAPAIQGENERIFYTYFEVDLEPGLGTQTGQGSNPQIMMRMSNDGGKTWGVEHMRGAGKVGKYMHRARWERLGQARRRVFEVSVSDPISWRLVDAFVGLSQQPRYPVTQSSG